MAGFVVHDLAARIFLNKLSEVGVNLSEANKRDFLFGNLIVDSVRSKKKDICLETDDKELNKILKELKIYTPNLRKEEKVKLINKKIRDFIQEEKKLTHFRTKEDSNKNIQVPHLELFIKKYKSLLDRGSFSTLGYFFHLYTDKRFFSNLSQEAYTFLDENNEPSFLLDKTKKVYIKKNNKICDVILFHSLNSEISLYDDYTTMNKILLDYYNIDFNADKLKEDAKYFINPGIEEVDYKNIIPIINKMGIYIQESMDIKNPKLNVFTEKQVIDFIEDTAKKFIFDYYEIINNYIELEEQKAYVLKTNN